MYHRNDVNHYYEFRTFFGGSKNSVVLPEGVIFEGVSKEPQFYYGASGAQDLLIPILDTFLGISEKFPENEMKVLLMKYRDIIPKVQVEYLESLRSRSSEINIFNFCKEDPETLYYFLKCADGIRKFRETHFNLVTEYIIKQEKIATGSGGSNPVIFLPNNIISLIE